MFTIRERDQHHILDFDIENRPLSYWWGDKTTAEITAIAWAWIGVKGDPAVRTLLPPPDHEGSALRMLRDFRRVYDLADMVVGHYIRMHDLPIINSAMIEYGLEPLGPKMTQDTKLDLIRHGELSASQLNLAGLLDVQAPKPRMSSGRWRDANRLTDGGIDAAVERVKGDVIQNMEMRDALLERGLLKPPRMWRP